jgi:hypothetical protein
MLNGGPRGHLRQALGSRVYLVESYLILPRRGVRLHDGGTGIQVAWLRNQVEGLGIHLLQAFGFRVYQIEHQ